MSEQQQSPRGSRQSASGAACAALALVNGLWGCLAALYAWLAFSGFDSPNAAAGWLFVGVTAVFLMAAAWAAAFALRSRSPAAASGGAVAGLVLVIATYWVFFLARPEWSTLWVFPALGALQVAAVPAVIWVARRGHAV
ncbi:MAG: hypothetical protein ABI890_05760, partial [Lapillicoccus sp.]